MAWFGCLAMSRPRRCAIMRDDCKWLTSNVRTGNCPQTLNCDCDCGQESPANADCSNLSANAVAGCWSAHGCYAASCSHPLARVLQSPPDYGGTRVTGQAVDSARR